MDDRSKDAPARHITLDVSQGKETVGYFQGTFEQMQTLGLLDEAEVSHMLGSLTAQQQMLDECRAMHQHPGFEPQGFDPLSGETFTIVSDNITSATKILAARQQLEAEIDYARLAPDVHTQDVPLLNQIVPYPDAWPRDLAFRWNNIGFQLLGQSGVVLDASGLSIMLSFRKGHNVYLTEIEDDAKNSLTVAGSVITALHDPRNQDHLQAIPADTIAVYEDTYHKWQEASDMLPDVIPSLDEGVIANVSAARKHELGVQTAALGTELAQLIAEHAEQTSAFRPNWSTLEKKAGLRPFYNKLLHVSRSETSTLAIASAQDAKRLTGVLHSLEKYGSNPERFADQIDRLITNEQTTGTNIQRVKSKLAALGTHHTEEWRSVQDDIRFLNENWPIIQEIVRGQWRPAAMHTSTTETIATISQALDFAVRRSQGTV